MPSEFYHHQQPHAITISIKSCSATNDCITYGGDIHCIVLSVCSGMPTNITHHTLYCSYMIAVHDHLGSGNCIEMGSGNHIHIPVCIVKLIRKLYTDPCGEYMGHRWL